jgi:hypothetical protein
MIAASTAKPAPNAIPEGETFTATVTFRNRVHNDYANFVVTLDLPQGRIEVCSGISFPGALKNFGTACIYRLPKMIRALPKNQIGCTPLGWITDEEWRQRLNLTDAQK